jgi:uncharacterized membrane protein
MEETFVQLADFLGMLVEMAAVLIVAYGSIEAFVRLVGVIARPRTTHGMRKVIWRRFGMWLVLGLEFELAADIIASVIAPTWMDIGKLGAIAVIRTFLNYFLEQDLEGAAEAGEVSKTTGEPVSEH